MGENYRNDVRVCIMKITSIFSRFKLWCLKRHLKRQCRPNPGDIKNEEVENCQKRLEGDSEKETLTNILEWQDRNIQFWWERWPIGYLLKISVRISFLLALIIVLLCDSNFLNIFALLVVFVALFFVSVFSNIVFQILYPFLLLPFVYRITNLASHNPILTQIILFIYVGCLGAIVLMVYLIIRHNILSEKSKKQTISKFIEVVNDTTRLSLPVEKIVKNYRRAVCRDYAKLTAALLFSLYPNSKVYFFAIPRHVAAAVKINDKYYVLDQKLPLLTKNGWRNKWNRKDTKVYVSALKRNSEGIPIDVTFDYQEQINRKSKIEIPKVCTEELTERIANILGIEQSPPRNEPFEIPLDDYAIYYDDDEITKYSLIRAIKNRFEGELCGNMDNVSKIEISQNESDLIVTVYL